jgi:hypothetical protein
MFGLNCQAVCDVHVHFLFFSVVAPGKTNHCVAFAYYVARKDPIYLAS